MQGCSRMVNKVLSRFFSHPCDVPLSATDAAGVLYFGRLFDLCHSAYEAALRAGAKPLRAYLTGEIILPIVRCEAQFKQPIYCSDSLRIDLSLGNLKNSGFQIDYHLYRLTEGDLLCAIAMTHHVCIDRHSRQRSSLPPELVAMLTASS